MSVLAWIATVVSVAAALVVAVVALALLSLVRIEARVASGGASARGRWGPWGFEIDAAADRLVVRLLGLRVVRTSLRRVADEPHDDLDAEARRERELDHAKRRRVRKRLSTAAYRRLARQGWRELRGIRRGVHVDRLRLEAVVASDDPAWTGEVYGIGCAVLGVVRSWWPDADVHVAADFVATEPRGAGELALRVRPVRLVPGAARIGWAYWRERRLTRRRA